MTLRAYCDNCECQTSVNAAAEPITLLRERLELRIEVLGFNGTANPIVCLRCVRLAAQHGDEIRG